MKTLSRPLYNEERIRLSESISRLKSTVDSRLNWPAIILLSVLTVLFAFHIYLYDKSNWSLISKFLVFVCPIIIWVMVENKYKGRKKRTKELDELMEIQRNDSITVIQICARRVIEFVENEDEGTLYLIEDESGQNVYLWDEQYLIDADKPFPCSRFDIYLDDVFKYAIEDKVHCQGDRIEPIKISGKDKWAYFKIRGFPDDLQVEEKKLEDVIKEATIA